jgi:hypothetical protein
MLVAVPENLRHVANLNTPDFAFSEAMRMSQASASSKPPPMACPLTAGIIGLVALVIERIERGRTIERDVAAATSAQRARTHACQSALR